MSGDASEGSVSKATTPAWLARSTVTSISTFDACPPKPKALLQLSVPVATNHNELSPPAAGSLL